MITITWLSFGVGQLILMVLFLIELRHPPRDLKLGAIMITAGGLLAVLNMVWIITDGPAGNSPIPMRGGVLGFWLSLVTAAEVVAFGAFMLTRSRRP